MRQDPDIMLVGEVRDEETAKLAVAAAETGHLVFTTLHTNNAIETLSRLDRLGVNRYQLQTLIRLVVAQRLIGVLCPHCKTAREIKQHERDILARLGIAYDPAQIVYEKRGCSHCNGVGTSGRTAVYSFFAHRRYSGNDGHRLPNPRHHQGCQGGRLQDSDGERARILAEGGLFVF